MPRELAGMTPHELRERDFIGLHDAKRRIEAARLLDRAEAAATLEELRGVVVQFIKSQTGEK